MSKTFNEQFGLDKPHHHDIDETTRECKKCHKAIEDLIGELKTCPIVGSDEFHSYGAGDE